MRSPGSNCRPPAEPGLSETASRLRAGAPDRRPLRGHLHRPPDAYLPDSTRLLMLKDDGSVLVHADAGGYKPLNWMTPPTVFEQGDDTIVVRKRAGR